MDIYSYAESINWSADYIDMRTGRIYKIQEAGNMKKFFGIENPPIKVFQDGKFIGYASRVGGD